MTWSKLAIITLTVLAVIALSCNGGNDQGRIERCSDCVPSLPNGEQYREAEKHVPLPNVTPQEITVDDMLSWPVPPTPASDAPRTGLELQLFHISSAFLEKVELVPGDCDISMQISATLDPAAPRVIVETPVDLAYCTARTQIKQQLATHGISLPDGARVDVNPPLPMEVVGLAFQDFPHDRGALVATTWELHPAIVNLK